MRQQPIDETPPGQSAGRLTLHRWDFPTILLLAMLIFCASAVQAARDNTFLYSVKFVCVNEVGPATVVPIEGHFQPAAYRTVVNVHNITDRQVRITKGAVLARSQDEPRGPISQRETEVLLPGQALAVDCIDISRLLSGPGQLGDQPIGDGFVLVESSVDLSVAAVYTALFVEEKRDQRVRNPDPEIRRDILNKIVFKLKPPRGGDPSSLPVPPGKVADVVVTTKPGQVLDAEKEVRRAFGNALPADAQVEVLSVELGVGRGIGKGLGLGLGLGVGAGISIDVEYIEPKVLRRRRRRA